MGLILNPVIHLRKYPHRILAFSVDKYITQPIGTTFIHPKYAVFLTMFDGARSYEENIHDLCFLLSLEKTQENLQKLEKDLTQIKQDLKVELLVEKSALPETQQNLRYNPQELIIPLKEVNLDPVNSRLDFPLSLNFNVTTNCAMACKYCSHPKFRMDEYIALERLDCLFSECAQKGCQYITLTGGDPFNRPDIIELLTLLNKKALKYFISTKSALDEGMIQKLKDAVNLHMLQLSLDSANAELTEFLTGMPAGYFTQLLTTIRNLKSAGIKVRIKGVLTHYNITGLEDLLKLCAELEVDYVHFDLYSRSLWHHQDNLLPSPGEINEANMLLERYQKEANPFILTGGSFHPTVISCKTTQDMFTNRIVCNTGRSGLTLLPNGEVTICEQLPYVPEVILGDLRVQSIEEYWNSPKLLDFLNPPPRSRYAPTVPCYTCQAEDYVKCHKCFSICLKDSYCYFRNLNSPDVRCKLAGVEEFRLA